MLGKRELFAELCRVSNVFEKDCLRKLFRAMFSDSGVRNKIFNSVIFRLFCLIYNLVGSNCRSF